MQFISKLTKENNDFFFLKGKQNQVSFRGTALRTTYCLCEVLRPVATRCSGHSSAPLSAFCLFSPMDERCVDVGRKAWFLLLDWVVLSGQLLWKSV